MAIVALSPMLVKKNKNKIYFSYEHLINDFIIIHDNKTFDQVVQCLKCSLK